MLGTIVNTGCIIVGSLVGTLFKKGLGEKYSTALFHAMGLASIALGANSFVQNMPKSEFPVLFILSLAIGGLIGTALDLDGRVKRLVAQRTGEGLAKGLISACLLYCIGTFSIVGPVLSALNGDNTFLYTNSTLDLVTSTVFATTFGLLQGTLVNELAIVGGVLIISSGLSILDIKDCKTLNFLPGLLVPVVWFLIKSLF